MSDLPQITATLPPRKRAKTQEEKEQRRIERILRNRRAAHASREKKRKHVEYLESSVHKLETNIKCYKAKEEKLLELSKKLLEKVNHLGGEVAGIDTSVLDEAPIPEVELDQPFFDSIKSNSRSATPVSDSFMGFNGADDNEIDMASNSGSNDDLSGSTDNIDDLVNVSETTTVASASATDRDASNLSADAKSDTSTSSSADASDIPTPTADVSNAGSAAKNKHSASIPTINTESVSKNMAVPKSKLKKAKTADTKNSKDQVKVEEIESPIPTSPLSTPLLKHEYISPFKTSESSSLVQSPGYLSNTLDITSNDYMSSNSSSFSGESGSSPVSSADSSPDSTDTNLSVDEYLSNLTNPLFLPTDYENNPNVKSEFPSFFNGNDKVALFDNGFLGEPFEEDQGQNMSSRLHNPAAVFYDFAI